MVADALRVAVDATPLLGAPTGVGTFVSGALGSLVSRSGVHLTGYALSLRGGAGLSAVLPSGVETSRLPLPAGALLRLWARADFPPIEWWAGGVHAVHGTNFVVPPARRAARVVTVHDLTPVRFPELCSATSLRYPALVRRAVRAGAMVHTPSETVRAEVLDHFGAAPDQVRAVPHGVGASGHTAEVVPLPAGLDGVPYLLALGTAEPRKDLPGLVAAFDLIAGKDPEIRLVLAGPAGWGEQALTGAVAAAVHRERIVRLGWVSPAVRAALFRHASVFVYPSKYEGFGLPPLEAMAAGVPVVATRAGAVPEVVDSAAVLVDPSDPEALADAVSGVLAAGEGERRAMIEAGRARAALYTWDRCAAGLEALYRDAVACAS